MPEEKIKLESISKSVQKLTKFDATEAYLKEEVAKTINVTADNLEDPIQLDKVKRARIDLRKVEKEIEDTGISYRRMFTSINKQIAEKEKTLLAITSPEVERLKTIEADAKALEIKKEREIVLPYRREKLAEVGNVTKDEELLEMDDKKYGEYLMEKTEEKNEKDRLAQEEKDREKQRKIDIAKAKEEGKKEAKEEVIETIKKAEVDKGIAKVKEEAKLSKQTAYQDFLKEHNCTQTTKENFYIKDTPNEVVLYKEVGRYKKNN